MGAQMVEHRRGNQKEVSLNPIEIDLTFGSVPWLGNVIQSLTMILLILLLFQY